MFKKIVTLLLFCVVSMGTYAKEYYKIAAGSPAIAEILYELGLKDRLIAVDKNTSVEGLNDVPKISFYRMNIESIYSLKADLLIFSSFNKADRNDFAEFLTSKGVDVIFEPEIRSIDDIYKTIRTLGEKTGREERAEEIIAKMQSDIEEITKVVKNVEVKKKVYFEVAPFPNMYTFGGDVFMNDVLEKAGTENIFRENKGWFIPNTEVVAAKRPDLIFTSTYQLEDPVKEIITREGWGMVKAVKNKEVYRVSANSVKPSIKVVDVIRDIAHTSYPELYGDK